MERLIVVGCGNHFRSNLVPALKVLEKNGLIEVVATVDSTNTIDASSFFGHKIPHLERRNDQSLSHMLHDFSGINPVILLAHSNFWHVSDAVNLVHAGFRIILEKPYAINLAELALLRSLWIDYPNQVAFAEYYLMMKVAPLLHAAALLNKNSFYLEKPDFLRSLVNTKSLEDLHGVLQNIGKPRMIYCDILEGEGLTGTFHHRGVDFFDKRNGGGVIMDLAIHAIAPLVALDGFIGKLPELRSVSVKNAVCDIYLDYASNYYKIPDQFIAESFAEIHFATLTDVPVRLFVGKYVLPNINQRRLIIIGDEGEAFLDMSSCTLSLGWRDSCPLEILGIPKRPESKYVPVLLASLGILDGTSPYMFDSNEVALQSQEFALAIVEALPHYSGKRITYQSGATPSQIASLKSE